MDNQNQQPPVSEPTFPPQPVVSQSSTPIIPPPRSNKLLLLIAVLVVLIAVATGSYIFATKQTQTPPQQAAIVTPTKPPPSPTPDPTADWKIYSADFFSLSYPPESILRENSDKSISFFFAPKSAAVYPDVSIQIIIPANFDRAKEEYTKNLINKREEQLKNGVKISGDRVRKIEGPSKETVVLLKHLTRVIVIVYEDYDGTEASKPIFSQILQTFKFTQ